MRSGIKKETVERARRAEVKAVKEVEKGLGTSKTAHAQTADSFQNFALQLGVGTDNPMSASTYGFNPLTRVRVKLEWIYRGSWIGGTAVDAIPDDMTRGGIEIQSALAPKEIEKLNKGFVRLGIWRGFNRTLKWARLYGGAVAVLLIDGQDFSTPLRIDTVGKGQFKGIAVFDRWMIDPSLNDLVTELGPEMGTPKYYTVNTDGPTLRGAKIHYSRIIRFEGVELPYWQKVQENLWGISVYERLYDRLVAFDSATQGLAQTIHKMHLRIIKIAGLRKNIAAGGPAYNAVLNQVAMMRRFQNNEGITMLDGDDEYQPNQVNVSTGFSEALMQFGQQISGALGIPLVRLFGQSPAGLNSTGESDIITYYDEINERQENELRIPLTVIGALTARSLGIVLDGDFDFAFNPLWQMKATEKADINAKETATVLDTFERGVVELYTALSELRESGRRTGHWTNITDEMIEKAKIAPPPNAAELMAQGGAAAPHNLLPKPKLMSTSDEWQESKHKRDDEGKFAEKEGGGVSKANAQTLNEIRENLQVAQGTVHMGITGGLSDSNKSAIKNYTGAAFKQVNGHLVGGLAATDQTKKTIEDLDDLMSRASLPALTTVFRGAGSLAVKNILEQAGGKLKKGQILNMSGFTSTSTDSRVASQFASQSRSSIMMEMRLPKGSQAFDISKFSDLGEGEKETLIARNSKFKVVSYNDKSKTLILEMIMNSKDKKPFFVVDDFSNKKITDIGSDDRFNYHTDAGITVSGDDKGEIVLTLADLGEDA